MHAFERQDSRQTLADGILEYYQSNPGLARGRGMSPAAQEFFRCHDAVHVVYGCGLSLIDEAVVKLSSIAGTTGGLGVLRGYRLHDSLEIYKKLSAFEVLATVLQSVVVVPRTLLRCVRQRYRWPWSNFDPHMHTPLSEIREEFGIRVAHVNAAGTDA